MLPPNQEAVMRQADSGEAIKVGHNCKYLPTRLAGRYCVGNLKRGKLLGKYFNINIKAFILQWTEK